LFKGNCAPPTPAAPFVNCYISAMREDLFQKADSLKERTLKLQVSL